MEHNAIDCHQPASWEKVFVLTVIFFSTGAVMPLLQAASGVVYDPVRGNVFMQALWAGVYAVALALLWKRRRHAARLASRGTLLWLLVGLALVSVFWSEAPVVTLRRGIALLGTTAFGLYLAVCYTRREVLELLAWAFGLIAVLSMGFVLFMPSLGIQPYYEYTAWRGVYENKNTLGGMMALAAITWLLYSASRFKEKHWGLFFFALAVVLLFRSGSVTAMLIFGALLALALIFCKTRGRNFFWVAGLLVLLAGGYLAWWLGDSLLTMILDILGRNETLSGRTELWQVVGELIWRRPWLGYGYNAFWLGWQGPSGKVWQVLSWTPPHAHNGYLDVWLQLGLAGLALLSVSLLAGLIKALNLARRKSDMVDLFPLLLFVFMAVHNITESTFMVRNDIFWMLFVLTSIQLNVKGVIQPCHQPGVAILTNIIAPYRLPVYRVLAEQFHLSVLYSGWEDNRNFWRFNDIRDHRLRIKKAWGFCIKVLRKRHGRLFDYWYLHINPGFLAELIRLKPDAVITNEMGFRTLMALVYGSVFGKPVWVCWEGSLHTEKNTGPFKIILRRLMARWARRWISFGEAATEYLLTLGIPAGRILQVQNCVDERWFVDAVATPVHNLNPKPVFLYAGQLINRKGVRYLLDAAATVQGEGYRFSLLIVGEGPERARLEQYASSLNLKNVHFSDPVKSTDMAGIYRSADLFILPTLHDVWGLVVNEALWSGLPVLCSKYAGCARELLPPENIFDPLDPADFAAALRRALTGRIAPPDHGKLRTCREVALAIAAELKGVLQLDENRGFS